MIKALRITSIIAAIAAVLAVVLIVFPAVFGVRSNEHIEQFLNSASVIDMFNETKGDRTRASSSQVSPLVKQAQAFALYLNPPPKPRPTRAATPRERPSIPRRPTGLVSPKFKLIGTSVYASHPEMSFALIDEPGKGLSWVKQSGKLGHLIIEQIKDGLVVVRDGQRTFELTPERPIKRSLLKRDEQLPDVDLRLPLIESEDERSKIETFVPSSGRRTRRSEIKSRPPQASAEEVEAAGKFIDKLKAIRTSIESDGDEERDVMMGKLISDFQAMRIGDEEAKRLDHLGRELKAGPMDINAEPNRIEDNEAENTANSLDPNAPEEE